ncbi:trehalase-like isoform X1 [Paramacrobiotus metropolitanus]|uniref:trehalase-like isoform X1 n=1 Tax=Paramacrobiotus metropolitanus TaxID=2943436 RepID=UPI0024459F11|nr:trehalase-like isoform X1 [Paramacrobiotus metropolitanus]
MSTISIPVRCISVIIGLCLYGMKCDDHLQPEKIDTIPCESELFCDGRFLHAIQLSGMFSDSKEFVDRPLRVDANVVINEFTRLMGRDKKIVPQNLIPQMKNLVDSYFLPVGSDVEEASLLDWQEDVPLVRRLRDRHLRNWAAELHGKWKEFGRKFPKQTEGMANQKDALIAPLASKRFFIVHIEMLIWMWWLSSFFLACAGSSVHEELRFTSTAVVIACGQRQRADISHGCQVRRVWPLINHNNTGQSVIDHPHRHSLIALPYPFISPGEVTGRFREQHYWDAYWIIHGLLISGMNQTARGMILNFASLVDRFGYVPIGNRVYYQNRPQMPILAVMVRLYWSHNVHDAEALIKETLPAIEREYDYWMTFRAVDITTADGRKFTLNRYKGSVTKPRPESYREDLETARSLRNRSLPGVEDKLFANIAAASASGWEFSSRWLDGPDKALSELRAEDIVPVDLNAMMCLTEEHMATFYKLAGVDSKSTAYMTKASQRGDAIQAVLWNDAIKMWRDYDLRTRKHRKGFYLSSITPLFASCGSRTLDLMDTHFLRDLLASRDIKKALSYPGGMPVSFVDSRDACHSCQWDFPNMWPTMQLMLIEAVARNSEMREEAANWAQNLINAIHGGYMRHGLMFQNYNVNQSGYYGRGGEYVVQSGYAATNGAILRLLELFPNILHDGNNNEILDKDEKQDLDDHPRPQPHAQPSINENNNGLASSDQPAIDTGETFQFLAQMHTVDPMGSDHSQDKVLEHDKRQHDQRSDNAHYESPLPSKRVRDNPGNNVGCVIAARFMYTASILLILVIIHDFY